jgi:hypothetical protein
LFFAVPAQILLRVITPGQKRIIFSSDYRLYLC